MKLVGELPRTEQANEEKLAIATEIHGAIMTSLKTLLDDPDFSENHSSVVELRGEEAIAERALKNLIHNSMHSEAA